MTNRFCEQNKSPYEKSNHIEYCVVGDGPDDGFVLEHAGVDHDHHASNHGHSSAATAHTNDDYNDTHGRLLIAKADRGCVCYRHGRVAVFAFQKTSTDSTGHRSAHGTDSSVGEPVATTF